MAVRFCTGPSHSPHLVFLQVWFEELKTGQINKLYIHAQTNAMRQDWMAKLRESKLSPLLLWMNLFFCVYWQSVGMIKILLESFWMTPILAGIGSIQSGYLVIWLSGYLVIKLSGYEVIWLSGYLVIWLSGYQVIWLSGDQVIWFSGYQVIWLSGYLVNRLSGYLSCLDFSSLPAVIVFLCSL